MLSVSYGRPISSEEANFSFIRGIEALEKRRYREAADFLSQVPMTCYQGIIAYDLRLLALSLNKSFEEAFILAKTDPFWKWLVQTVADKKTACIDNIPSDYFPALRYDFLGLLEWMLRLEEFELYEQTLPLLDYIYPDELEKLNSLSDLYEQLGFLDMVVDTLLPFAQSSQLDKRGWRSLARVCQKKGLYQEAVEILLRLVQGNESKEELIEDYTMLANCYIALDKPEDAQQILSLVENIKTFSSPSNTSPTSYKSIPMDIRWYLRLCRLGLGHPNEWINKSGQVDGILFVGEHEFLWEFATKSANEINGHILHIGNWLSKPTCIFAGACIENAPNTKVFCVDNFFRWVHCSNPHEAVKNSIQKAQRLGFYDWVVSANSISELLKNFPDLMFRTVFVEEVFDYEDLKAKLNLILPKLNPQGILILRSGVADEPNRFDVCQCAEDLLSSDLKLRLLGICGTMFAFEKISVAPKSTIISTKGFVSKGASSDALNNSSNKVVNLSDDRNDWKEEKQKTHISAEPPNLGQLKILFAYRSDIDVNGGAARVMKETAKALQEMGVHVDITYEIKPDVKGYDLAHAFGSWIPQSALIQLVNLKETGIPIVWFPFYLIPSEFLWAEVAIKVIYFSDRSPEEKRKFLKAFIEGNLEVNGMSRWKPYEYYPGFYEDMKDMLNFVDHICVSSYSEIRALNQATKCVTVPFTVTPHGVDAELIQKSSPKIFCEKFGLKEKEFILCVGSVEHRKNQLMLVEALKKTGLKLVLIGPYSDPNYLTICLKEGMGQVIHIDRLEPELIASAQKAAKVHALPSFAECAALVNLEAAAAGCALVVSNRSSEFEYFGDYPYYCDPTDPSSILDAVLRAYENYPAEKDRWEELSKQVKERFTWQKTAQLTLQAYQRTLQKVQKPSSKATVREKIYLALRQEAKTGVLWTSPIYSFSGYSWLSRHLLPHLVDKGVFIQVQSIESKDTSDALVVLKQNPEELAYWKKLESNRVSDGVAVCFHIPTDPNNKNYDIFSHWRRRNEGFKRHVGMTMFETDHIPDSWVKPCNLMDEIWLPSSFNKEIFSKAGVDPNKIQVIPFGIDTSLYDPQRVKPLAIEGKKGFTFLSVFQWIKRKGWDILLQAYLSAFSEKDDVCLVLRSYPDENMSTPLLQQIYDYIHKLGYELHRIPPIILLEEFLPDRQMPSLYRACDAFVLPTRGEGWGIPFMEAMAMELPVIATRWSGQLDFMNDDNSYLIDIEGLVPVDPEQIQQNPCYYHDNLWAQPSVEHTASLMRYVYEHPKESKEKGKYARKYIQQNWSIQRTAEWVKERINYLTKTHSTISLPLNPSVQKGREEHHTTLIKRDGEGQVQKDSSLSVIWHAPLFDPSGYADEARQFILGLDEIGVNVRAVPINWSNTEAQLPWREVARLRQLTETNLEGKPIISVFHIFPPYFDRISQAVYHIGRTMYETDRIPKEWVEACNKMDEIWLPSQFNIETFIRSGVKPEKVYKIPGGIQLKNYPLDANPLQIEGSRKFNFLSVFDWQLRKGWDVLLQAFIEEFGENEDVALIVKVWSSYGRSLQQILNETINFFRKSGLAKELPSNIVFYQRNLSTDQMVSLYKLSDAFVLPSRGEGWCRPLMEGALMEVPVIATRWSGHLEFLNDENAYLIDCQLVDISPQACIENPIWQGHRWAEPSVSHLRQIMRQVYEERDESKRKAKLAREHIIENYNHQKVARKLKERLQIISETVGHKKETSSLVTRSTSFVKGDGCKQKASFAQTVGEKVTVKESFSSSQNDISKSQTKPIVVWEGGVFSHHSFALFNREVCLQLIDAGCEVSIAPIFQVECEEFDPKVDERFHKLVERINISFPNPVDVHVRHQWPFDFSPPNQAHWVNIQPWEFGSLPKFWLKAMSEMVDEVWVYTTYLKDCYIKSGFPEERVHVVPCGVNPDLFHPNISPLDLPELEATKGRFKFLFVGGSIWRKGIDLLLQAYLQAFKASDDVCLIIKEAGKPFYKGINFARKCKWFQEHPKLPKVIYLQADNFSPQLIPHLYGSADCLVHPYRGEGFGLPIAEAMACGLPVIVTNYGSALDFCNSEVAYLIPAEEKIWEERRVGHLETVDYPWTAEPDIDALAQLMRHVYENYDEAKKVGLKASQHIITNFSWAKSAEKALQRIYAIKEQPILRHQRGITFISKPSRPLLSLCMIVKDEEKNLPRCLESVKDIVDETIIVDTGSTDKTVEIAEKYGAKVFHFEWTGSFSEARNESLKHATGEWILFLDADEVLSTGKEDLRRILLSDAEHDGFIMPMVSFVGYRSHREGHVHPIFRLFRNIPGVQFKRDLHEQIMICIQAVKPEAKFGVLSVWLEHYGYMAPVVQGKGKVQRNFEIARKELQENTSDPFSWFNLGREYLRLGQWERAFYCLRRSLVHLAYMDAFTPYMHRAICDCVHCLVKLRRYKQALDFLKEAQQFPITTPDFWFSEGQIRFSLGDWSGAIKAFEKCLSSQNELPVNTDWAEGVTSYASWYWLGMCQQKIGEFSKAIECYRQSILSAIKQNRYYDPPVNALVKLLISQRGGADRLLDDFDQLLSETIWKHQQLLVFIAKDLVTNLPVSPSALSLAERIVNMVNLVKVDEHELTFTIGRLKLLQRQYKDAADFFSYIPFSQPEGASAWNLTILSLALSGDLEKAISACGDDPFWQRLLYSWTNNTIPDLENLPSDSLPFMKSHATGLLALLLQLEEFDRFEQTLTFAKPIFSDEKEWMETLGNLYGLFELWDMVIETLLPLAQSGQLSTEGWRLLATACQRKGMHEEATEILVQILQEAKEKDEALADYMALAGSYIAQGKVEEAQQVLDLAAQLTT